MRFSDVPTNPDSRMLRQFAGLCIIFFGAIGGWQVYKGNNWGWLLVVLASVAGGLGLIWPKLLKPVFVTWMILAFPIGWMVSHIILAIVFFGCFMPLGMLLKLKGHDPLLLKKPATGSFWVKKTQQADVARYLKQF